jgi:hypothetical protein
MFMQLDLSRPTLGAAAGAAADSGVLRVTLQLATWRGVLGGFGDYL